MTVIVQDKFDKFDKFGRQLTKVQPGGGSDGRGLRIVGLDKTLSEYDSVIKYYNAD